MMHFFQFVVIPLLLPLLCPALLEESFVTFNQGEGSVRISDAPILYGSDDFTGVHIAVESLAKDFEQITGAAREIKNVSEPNSANLDHSGVENAIIVGSANCSLIRQLSTDGVIDLSDIAGKWESFKTSVVRKPMPGIKEALVIAGSDKRGTVFGIHTLAEQSGQSPYHWFADVPAKKHEELYALQKTTVHGEPTVKYRGLFINDEMPALTTWWAERHNASYYPLDAEFYSHVFDLLLRLKANFLWPAMWHSSTPSPGNIFFTDDPHNQQLADDYGIVVSTSHHEPMQRATNEWNSTLTGPWDWAVNKDNVTKFMEEGVRRAGHNESYFTMGMRGEGDAGLDSPDAIDILRDVFDVQRDIIKKHYGDESAVNQVWTIYKEVATYYAAGLNPPEDVTLMFPDDNSGNIQRLPTGNETSRKGGSGVYFHLEYVGSPRSYKWSNTNNLAKVLKELSQAHLRGANQIWLINVGDIKPMETPFSLTMDMAWDMSNFNSFDKLPSYLKLYTEREFGSDHADEIAAILQEHSHLIGMRRYELISPSTYSILNYHEAERILSRWRTLADKTKALYTDVEEGLKPAFYQLVYYPVISGLSYYDVTLGIGMNKQFAIERRNSANAIAHQVLGTFEDDYDIIDEYDSIVDGKWTHIMSQAKFDAIDEPPRTWNAPSRDMMTGLSFVQLRQNMQYSLGNLGIYAEESTSPGEQGRWAESIDISMPTTDFAPVLPVMDPYGPRVRHVDLFMRGDHRVPIHWTIDDIPVDWLSITPMEGTLKRTQADQRLNVTVIWDKVPEGFNDTVDVAITASPSFYPYYDLIRVPVQRYSVPSGFKGFPETAGMVSIEAPHFQRSSSSSSEPSDEESVSFEHIPFLGTRSESGSLALRPFLAAREKKDAATSAWVEYDFYLSNRTDAVNATVYINACLDTDPNLLMKYSLTLNSEQTNFTRVLGDPETAGDLPPEWMDHVGDQVWTKHVQFGAVGAGVHTLRWATNSPEVYLEKIVLNTHGGVKDSYLGPPETTLLE